MLYIGTLFGICNLKWRKFGGYAGLVEMGWLFFCAKIFDIVKIIRKLTRNENDEIRYNGV